MATQQMDLIDDIITDHREVEAVFKEIENSDNPAMRRQLVEHVITELVRHSVAEEQYLYPTARRVLPDGDKMAGHELEEHAKAEQVMKQIEESDLLPKLRDACDSAELGQLGEKFDSTKKLAPTRPHPSAPDKPPANKILGPGMGLIDRMRDALSGRTS